MSITLPFSASGRYWIQGWSFPQSPLLITGPHPGNPEKRIDLLFHRTDQLHLPTEFEGIFVSQATFREIRRLFPDASPPDGPSVSFFRIASSGSIGYVAAHWCRISEVDRSTPVRDYHDRLILIDEFEVSRKHEA
ncbi:hypothetical protein SAMN02745673_04759 [Marinactinospora thermotolerans DSM 45154]|uniref:Uncharacterized protein n=1 Tax=Marinactinospora thermotolerans DSM 45154 TaxID=1122192 RepID=A0A1T4TCQ2_9ACTN|nr:hypothetical protein SAMN02745673_04759 [Marinactinospora thermotolerans DSM 45154]